MRTFVINNHFTQAGSKTKPNQDYVTSAKTYAYCMDGATGLVDVNITKTRDDVEWYVKKFAKSLNPLIRKGQDLTQTIKTALKQTNLSYAEFDNSCDTQIYPSAYISLVRINKGKLDYYILGDCMLLIKYKDGHVEELQIEDLIKLDRININKMQTIAKQKNIDVIDARPLINDDLIATRLLMNTPEGYYTLGADNDAPDHGLVGSLDLDQVDSVIGCSDGFSQIYDTFFMYTKEQIFENIEKGKTLENLVKELRDKQQEDSKCNKYPRFKIGDDSSAFYVKL